MPENKNIVLFNMERLHSLSLFSVFNNRETPNTGKMTGWDSKSWIKYSFALLRFLRVFAVKRIIVTVNPDPPR